MERTATFLWHGPFVLQGKPRDAADKRLVEFAGFPGEKGGLYLLVGSMGRGLIRQSSILYIGQTGRTFRTRLEEHLKEGGRIRDIEKRGSVTSIWVATLESCPSLCLVPDNDDTEDAGDDPARDRGGPSELAAYENLLIHLVLRPQSHWPADARSHANRRGLDFRPPPLGCVMINRFNTTLWEAKKRPPWRPTMIPDVIDCQIERDTSRAQLIWTGTRGVRLHRKECRPAGLFKAAVSQPRHGNPPSL